MKLAVFIKNIIIITVILTIVFLSQASDLGRFGNGLYIQTTEKISEYGLKSSNWFKVNIYPRIGGGVEKGKESIEKEVNKQKDVAVKSVWEKFKNYFAEKF